MYSHFQFSEQLPAMPNAERLQGLLIAGNWLMLLGLLLLFNIFVIGEWFWPLNLLFLR